MALSGSTRGTCDPREMRGEEGMANLASAEESFSIGDYALAAMQYVETIFEICGLLIMAMAEATHAIVIQRLGRNELKDGDALRSALKEEIYSRLRMHHSRLEITGKTPFVLLVIGDPDKVLRRLDFATLVGASMADGHEVFLEFPGHPGFFPSKTSLNAPLAEGMRRRVPIP